MRRSFRLFHILFLLCLLVNSASGFPLPGRDEPNSYLSYPAEYRWLEIEDIGEPIVELEDNNFVGPIEIGFDFPYFGRLYDHVYICSNGMIGFGPSNEYQRSDNHELPDHNFPLNIVALFWKNLTPRTDWGEGVVYFGHREGKLVVQYQTYPEVNEDGHTPQNTITMQIVLESDGDILLQYKDIGEEFDINTGTIGLHNFDGSVGLTTRHNGEGVEVAAETAYLLSDHGPGSFLVWDGGTSTPSGTAQTEALRAEGHTVTYLQRRLNQQLPEDIGDFEAVFVNLGNFGRDGQSYHQLTQAEGTILADYARSGGNIYLEGSDFWTADSVTDAHPLFRIEGVADGRAATGPIVGIDGSLAEGLMFDEYSAQDNDYVDHLRALEQAEEVLTFRDGEETAVGMVSFSGEDYRTVSASFEFGGLIDGDEGTKRDLMRAIVEHFREPPPEFPRPVNLRARAGDQEVLIEWDMPRRGEDRIMRRLELQHRIASLIPRDLQKPDLEARREIIRLRGELQNLLEQELPARDDLLGFNIYLNNEPFDFTNSLRYTAIELENGTQCEFAVSAVYRDPDGESELSDPVFATPTRRWSPPVVQGFEQHNGALTATPGEDGWEWGVPAGGAANGQRAWATLLNGNYPNLADFELTTPLVSIPEQARTYLTFNHRYQCEAGWDGGRVEFSPDNGERWDVLVPVNGYNEQSIFAFDGGAGFSGNSNGWISSTFDLTGLAGEELIIRFHFKSDDSNVGSGWDIDDLRIYEPPTGNLVGTVRTSADQIPIRDALFVLNGNIQAVSDTSGRFRLDGVPAGNNAFVITAIGFAETRGNVEIQVNQELVRNFFMDEYDSRLTVNPGSIDEELGSGEESSSRITLTNEGNSATDFKVYFDYFANFDRELLPGPAESPYDGPGRDNPWDLLKTINLTERTGSRYHIAAEFIRNGTPGSYNLLTTAGDFDDDLSRFFLMNREGDVLSQVPQGGMQNNFDGWGVRDLAYDGSFVYGSIGNQVMRISPFSGVVIGNEFATQLEINRAIAWIPEENAFWVGDRDETWYKYRRNAQGVSVLVDRVTDHGLTGVVGMAWNPSDPNGACLYIHNQESDDGGAAIYRYNPRTRQLIRQLQTATVEEGFPGGAFTTYLWDTQTWMLGVVIQGADNDFLKLFELWPTRNWAKVTPLEGQLNGRANTQLQVSFDARGRVDSQHLGNLEIHDLRAGSVSNVSLSLTVVGGSCSLEGQISLDDGEGDVQQALLMLNDSSTFIDPEGNFTFINMNPGRYRLSAELDGYFTFESDSFTLAPDENARRNVQLSHIPRGILRGRVRNINVEDGWLPAIEISAVNEEDNQIFGIDTTDDEGSYEIVLAAGEYSVIPRKTGWRGESASGVEIRDGEVTELNFDLDDRLPMRNIRLNGSYDNQIVVSWDPPGLVGVNDSLRYDDGAIANAVFLRGRDDVIAVRFEPEGMYDIVAVQTYMFRLGDFGLNRWQIYQALPINYRIWLEDPDTGLPGEEIWNSFDPNRVATRWVTVATQGLRFLSGAFYVGWHQDDNRILNTYNATGVDNRLDNANVTHLRINGNWSRFNGLPGDNMIRSVIYRYSEDREERMAPRPAQELRSPEITLLDLADRIVIARGDPDAEQLSANSSLGDAYPNAELPPRDPPAGYRIIVDDQIAVEGNFMNNQWTYRDTTINENTEHTFYVVALYDGGDTAASPEASGRFNLAPGAPRGITVTNNGPNYTIRWAAPIRNADNILNCTDYMGCRIYINGEQVGDIEAPTFSFAGQIPEGDEGWYDVSLIAYDEVPNLSTPAFARLPLGESQAFNFDGNQPPVVFSATPFGSWSRTRTLVEGPGRAHSPEWVWGTRQPSPRHYENNANWILATVNEFLITSPNGRMDFYQYMSAEDGRDGGQVQISVDGGAYQLAIPIGGYNDQTVAAFQNRPAWTGEIPAWEFVSFDLSDYQGHTVRFRWVFKTDEAIDWYAGWYIDDLVIWGGSPPITAQIYGTVRDQHGQNIPEVSISNGRIGTVSNQQGGYRLTGIIPGLNNLTATALGFISDDIEADLNPRDSVRVDFELYRPMVRFDREEITYALGGNDRVSTEFTLENFGENALPYTLRLLNQSPNHDANRRQLRDINGGSIGRDQPGDVHFDYNLTNAISLQRIMGVEYAADQFFVTSSDPVRGQVVAVLSREGALVRQFSQPQPRIPGWGLRDLAWDGEFLYGSQNDSIYSFDTDGVLQDVQQGAPLTVNRALAFDADADGFWCGEYDSPWYLIDRDGEILIEWDGHGLQGVYGFAWHPAEPDDFPLYIANLEDDGSTMIYRANPERQVIEATEYRFEGAPTGLCLTGRWDANRWILGAVIGANPQRLIGVELGSRVSWITLDPIEGELAAGQSQLVAVEIAVPHGAGEGDRYEADIAVLAYNGIIATLSASLEIVEGFRHFEEPVESDLQAVISILSVDFFDDDLSVGSEIAVLTPGDHVGGAVRWIGNPVDLIAFGGDEGFGGGDSLAFIVWDAENNEEFRPEVEYVQGEPFFRENDSIQVRIVIGNPDRQVVTLSAGWNLISSFVIPTTTDIPTLFDEILRRRHLVMVKDGAGRFWSPRHNYIGLGQWNFIEGYQVLVNTSDSLVMAGTKAEVDTPIPLLAGWNTAAYLLDHYVDPRTGFESIMHALVLAKNGRGDFIVPRFGYYGIGYLFPGEGYKIKVDRRIDLIYGENNDRFEPSAELPLAPSNDIPSTGSDMSLLIVEAPREALGNRVILRAISIRNGAIVGQANLSSLPAGLVVRGDDTLTAEIDGALQGESLSISAIDGNRIIATLSPSNEGLIYAHDGFAVLSLEKSNADLPLIFTLSPTFPNPFNSQTTIRYGLPHESPVEIRLIDLHGRLIWSNLSSNVEAGWHSVAIDADDFPAGIYLLEVKAGQVRASEKLVLVR